MRKISILLALVLSASMMFAQDSTTTPNNAPKHGNFMQHRINFLTTTLSLTPAQQQQATTIFTNSASSERAMHTSMKTAHQSLQEAIKSNDAASIEQISTNIGNMTAQMTSAHAKAEAAFYQTLTPEQQTKMSQLESDRGGFGGRFGGGR